MQAKYDGTNHGLDFVNVTGCGAGRELYLKVSDYSLSITEPVENAIVPVGQSIDVTASLIGESGEPESGTILTFSKSSASGTLSASTATTSTDGTASVVYTAASFPYTESVTVEDAYGNTFTVNFEVRAVDADQLGLVADPKNVAVKVGDLTPTSTLTATVKDPNGFPVPDVNVSFAIVEAPGGGEKIEPLVVATDSTGQAATTFYSGSLTSGADGVKVQASVDGDNPLVATTTLTIGQEVAQILIGPANSATSVDDSFYTLPVTVSVIDDGGNAVPGQDVELSVTSLRFWSGYHSDPYSSSFDPVISGRFSSEDENRSGSLDSGEDGASGVYDWNDDGTLDSSNESAYYLAIDVIRDVLDESLLNGKLDPGPVASLPENQATTDENGMATFDVNYLKGYGGWVEVEIAATVNGADGPLTAIYVLTLPVENGDTPWFDSPFSQ